MAVVLVDYENVFMSNGLRGIEYLNPKDKLFVFYSTVCCKIANKDYENLTKARCEFKVHKLVNAGKNALDFYIATKVGMEYQKGERQIVIVSKDKGYSAVQDFINSIPCTTDRKIVRSANIEQGLVLLTDMENVYRRKLIAENNDMRDIAEAQAYIQAKADLRDEIEKVLAGTRFEEESAKIIDFIETDIRPSKKQIYSNTLHEYGIKDGLELYRILKEVV